MSLLIQNAGATELKYAHWFFYGESRSGKTMAAGTFPRPLFLVPKQEGSHMTLLGREDVDFVLLEGSASMRDVLDDLDTRLARARTLWRKGDEESLAAGDVVFPWGTVVVESITHYCDLVQEELTAGDTQAMSQLKWGKITTHLRHVQTRLRQLPVHAVFTSLDEKVYLRSKDGEMRLTEVKPMFPGKMTFKLPSACDCIVYFHRRAGKPNDIFEAHLKPYRLHSPGADSGEGPQVLAGCRPPQLRDLTKLVPFKFSEVQTHFGW